jgi:hypothetical protein
MDKYPNSKVGIKQGADTIFIDDDGYFNVDGVNVTGDQLRNALYAPMQIQRPVNSTLTTSYADSQKNLISGVGVVIFSTTSNHINMSFWLTSCLAGREVIMMIRAGSVTGASGVIWVSTSGCSLVGILGDAGISGFFLRGSAASQAYVKLKCLTDGEWSVVDYRTGYAEA